MNDTEAERSLHAQLAELANAVRERFRDERQALELVRDVVRRNEIVFAVWQDPGPDGPVTTEHGGERVPFQVWGGVAKMVVKGESVVRFIAGSGVAEELVMGAVPCVELEQALALRDAVKRGTMP
jgi:hypothetical protein